MKIISVAMLALLSVSAVTSARAGEMEDRLVKANRAVERAQKKAERATYCIEHALECARQDAEKAAKAAQRAASRVEKANSVLAVYEASKAQ